MLRAFCQAARLGSITGAARHLGSTQPAVSLRVRTLEKVLGVRLFERRGPHISLMRVGRRVYDVAMPLVVAVDRLPDTFAEDHRGEVADSLRIGAGQTSAAYVLPGYLKSFREEFPETEIEVRIGTGRERLGWLRGYELDVVVGAMDVPPADVEFHPILESEPVLVTPLDHPLAGRNSVSVEETAAYPFVGHAADHFVRQFEEAVMRMHGFVPDTVVEVDGWGEVTNYVAAGVGIAFVPDLCLTEHGQVWKISFKGAVPPRWYGPVTRGDGILTLAARRFVQIMGAKPSDAFEGP